jgi:hypothetical protein
MPTSGVRPQSAINDQLVDRCDILVGIFWTKLGTSTAEEIDRFVAAGKPAMLYFSRRKISTGKVDLKQAAKLSKFKATTYKRSLVGSFASVAELKRVLLRDLTRQVGMLQPRKPAHAGRIDCAREITELINQHKKNGITIEEFKSYDELLGMKKRSKAEMRALGGSAGGSVPAARSRRSVPALGPGPRGGFAGGICGAREDVGALQLFLRRPGGCGRPGSSAPAPSSAPAGPLGGSARRGPRRRGAVGGGPRARRAARVTDPRARRLRTTP